MSVKILTEGEINEIELAFQQVNEKEDAFQASLPSDLQAVSKTMMETVKRRRAEIVQTLRNAHGYQAKG